MRKATKMTSMGPWDIDEGITDAARFFALVPELFPDATLFFAEGSSISSAAEQCYASFASPGPYIPKRQTSFPTSKLFRCAGAPGLFQSLSKLAERSASPELLDHLALYQGDRAVLEWHDAFANAMLLDASVPEQTVAALARAFDRPYGRARFRKVSWWKFW
jgi:hypothetical protein